MSTSKENSGAAIRTTTDQNFPSDIESSKGVTMIDFWAEWCGPCRTLGPTLEEVAAEYRDKITVYKMNVDENPTTPSKFHVRGIPTVVLFKDGKPVDQFVGLKSKSDVQAFVQKHLA